VGDAIFSHLAPAGKPNLVLFRERWVIRDAEELGEHARTDLIDEGVLWLRVLLRTKSIVHQDLARAEQVRHKYQPEELAAASPSASTGPL